MHLTDVSTGKQLLDIINQVGPVFREVARNHILERTRELYSDCTAGRGRDEGKNTGLEIIAVHRRDRDLVWTRRDIDKVGRIHAIFEVNGRSLACGAVVVQVNMKEVKERVGTYRSTLSFPTIWRTFVIMPSWAPSYMP